MSGASGEVQSPDHPMAQSPDRFLLPYCVVLEGPLEVPKTGVSVAEVHSDSAAGLTVLYSTLPSQKLSPDTLPRAALEFWDVIRRALEQRAVIPFRFPTWVSKTELRKHLEDHREEYSSFLRQFANCVQIDIRVTPRNAAEQASASINGTEYMLKLQKWRRWVSELPATLEEITHIKARSWHHREERNAVRLFALVERGSAVEFSERLSEFCDLADANIRVSGPWPATAFLP